MLINFPIHNISIQVGLIGTLSNDPKNDVECFREFVDPNTQTQHILPKSCFVMCCHITKMQISISGMS